MAVRTRIVRVVRLSSVMAALVSLVATEGRPARASNTGSNPITAENALAGTASWELSRPAQYDYRTFHFPTLEGYASTTAASAGDTVNFFVSTSSQTYAVDVYRMGWYRGKGARLVQSLGSFPGQAYGVPQVSGPDTYTYDPAYTGLIDATWPVGFSLAIPSTWTSGQYLFKLTASGGDQAYIPLVIKDSRASDFILVTDVNTYQAYNAWGRKSLYTDTAITTYYPTYASYAPVFRAVKVSFNRPYMENHGAGQFLNWEYQMVRWLEQHGYDVSYTTDADVDLNPGQLTGHKGIIIAGHSEYWSMGMRKAFAAAVAGGVNLAVFSGNTSFHKVRHETSPVQPGIANRVIVRYPYSPRYDPYGTDPVLSTTDWRDAIVNMPEQSLLGEMYGSDHTGSWVVSDAANWVLAGTGLQNGGTIPGLVGYEYDRVDPGYPVPAGEDVFASSPMRTSSGIQNANSVTYTASSGARVVDVGTILWSWALDGFVAPYGDVANHGVLNVAPAVQTMTSNILNNFAP